MRTLFLLVICFCVACTSFSIQTPPELIDFNVDSRDEHLAMTHDGVVLRVKVHRQGEGRGEVPRADLDFWVKSTRERMRTAGGYALLSEESVHSANGVEGRRLEFGRDQGNRPYRYMVVVFVTEERIHVVDAGGRQERYDAVAEAIEAAVASYEVRR